MTGRRTQQLLKGWKEMRDDGVAVYDFEPRRLGDCGRKDKLTPEAKAVYRSIIERRFYSFRLLSEGDAEDGFENCGLSVLWNDDLPHLIRMGFSND